MHRHSFRQDQLVRLVSVPLWGAFVQEMQPSSTGVAPIGVRGVLTGTSTSSTLTVNKPAGTINGDVLVLMGSSLNGSNGTMGLPAGFTSLANLNSTDTGFVAIKLASSEPASYTLTPTATVIAASCTLLVLTNAQAVLDGTVLQVGNTATSHPLPALSPSLDNDAVICFGVANQTFSSTITGSWSLPFTEQSDVRAGSSVYSWNSSALDVQTTATPISSSMSTSISTAVRLFCFAVQHV